MKVPFNVPTLSGSEFDYMRRALATAHLSGNGEFRILAAFLSSLTDEAVDPALLKPLE